MKNTLFLFLLLTFGIVGCSEESLAPIVEESKEVVTNTSNGDEGDNQGDNGDNGNNNGDEGSGEGSDSTSTPNPDFLQLIPSDSGLVLTVHQDSTFEFANFEAEVNYNDTSLTLTDITTTIDHGFFVWNPDYIGYTESGLKRAKFAFASADNIEDKELVTLHLTVNESSEVCLVDVLYHNIDYKDICITITKE